MLNIDWKQGRVFPLRVRLIMKKFKAVQDSLKNQVNPHWGTISLIKVINEKFMLVKEESTLAQTRRRTGQTTVDGWLWKPKNNALRVLIQTCMWTSGRVRLKNLQNSIKTRSSRLWKEILKLSIISFRNKVFILSSRHFFRRTQWKKNQYSASASRWQIL